MARYYFHIRDRDRLIIDDEGLEFYGDVDALAEAQASADDLIRDAVASGDDISDQVLEVMVDGRLVGMVAVRDRIARNGFERTVISDISVPAQEPRCPHCMKPFHGTFPTDSDEAPVKCPACGQVSPAAGWFAYRPDDSGGVEDLDE